MSDLLKYIDFDRAKAEEALAGNTRALGAAFIWDYTPQGFVFWAREDWEENLSDEARAILTEWVELAAEEATTDPLRDAAPDLLAALKELVRCVEGGDETAGISMDDALIDAHDAIEKAEGRE